MSQPIDHSQEISLRNFFEQPVAQRAMKPIKDGSEIALCLMSQGETITLTKQSGVPVIRIKTPSNPDMTFSIPQNALSQLTAIRTEDIGTIGIAIAKAMIAEDPEHRLGVQVHIGPFDLLMKGYLGVIPLGGKSFMKFLASKGFASLGQIREAISTLRTK